MTGSFFHTVQGAFVCLFVSTVWLRRGSWCCLPWAVPRTLRWRSPAAHYQIKLPENFPEMTRSEGRAQADLQKLYADREKWAQMSLKNTANSGIFSADRSVLDYARDIWHASAVK